jgi:hypothetical protein
MRERETRLGTAASGSTTRPGHPVRSTDASAVRVSDPRSLLHLQRLAGNAAVAEFVVQRCGATPCDCAADERQAVADGGAQHDG